LVCDVRFCLAHILPGDLMIKRKPLLLIFLLALSISALYAESFDPVNGTAYPFDLVEVTFNGVDRSAAMQSHVRSCAITFNADTTVMSVGNGLYNAVYTFTPDGTCEIVMKALFIRRSFSASSTIERSGRDFTITLSMQMKGRDVVAVMKGRIR